MNQKFKPMSPVSVIVPLFNEVGNVCKFVSDLQSELGKIPLESEIILVDDGSTDGSQYVCSKLKDVRIIHHDRNRGYGAALKSGIRASYFESIVILDADGTYPLEKLEEIINRLGEADMVVGARNGANVNYPVIRRLPKSVLTLFCEWIVGQKIPDINSGFRSFRKSQVMCFGSLLPSGFSFTTTLTVAMIFCDCKVDFVSIDYAERVGKSKFKPIRDTLRFAVTLLRLGVFFAPLRIFLPASILLGVSGLFTLLGDVFIREDITDRTVILLMSSVHIFILALLADVISRSSTVISGEIRWRKH